MPGGWVGLAHVVGVARRSEARAATSAVPRLRMVVVAVVMGFVRWRKLEEAIASQ